jgi:hypothetical protein
MSIQIIDGFQVNAATPIDNRIVASGSSARNAIPYKYEGLRVFDTSDSIPYVWLNNAWVSENATGIVGSGSASFVPLYTSSNVINNSWFYQSGFNISTSDAGLGTDRISMNARTGLLTAVNLAGAGSAITGIIGSNINNNSISVSGVGSKIIPSGTIDQVLVSGVSFTNWRNLSDVSVGTASISSQVRVTGTDLANANRPITFVDTVNISPINNTVKANSNLTYNPFTRTLVTGTVSSTRLVTTGDVRVGNNLNCVGGLIDIGVTGVSRNAFLFSGSTGVTELGSFLNRPIIFSTGNTTLSEKVRITSGGSFLIANLGSVADPAISFTSDSNTGIYAPSGGDNLAFVTGGIEIFRVRAGAASDFEFKSPNNLKKVGLSVYDSGYTTWTMSSSTTSTFDIIGYSGLVVYGSLSKSSGSFRIDHPLESKKSTHDLVHSFVEGPRADNIYRGKVILNNGSATINLDIESNMTEGTFILLNREVQCFTTNETGWTAVKGRVTGNVLQINSEVSCSDEISWMVIGERQDKHMYDTDWTDSNGKVIVEPLKKK